MAAILVFRTKGDEVDVRKVNMMGGILFNKRWVLS